MLFNKKIILGILILGLFFSIWMFNSQYVVLERRNNSLIINEAYYTHPSVFNNIRKIFSTPFDFNYFKLHLRLRDEINPSYEYTIVFRNDTYNMKNGDNIELGEIKLSENINFQILSNSNYSQNNLRIYTYVKPFLSESITKVIMFEIVLLSILVLFRELEKIIREK